jgi:glucose-1-phosphate thymidylyltransferase
VALFERDAMLAGSNVPAERIKRFAVATIDGRGCLERVIEKPDDATLAALPRPLWLSMNCWRFGPSIFAACRAIKPSPRGEFELPDAVQHAMHALGETFRAVTVRAPVLDMTSRADIAPVAAILAKTEVRL